jgi:hypothetical protein
VSPRVHGSQAGEPYESGILTKGTTRATTASLQARSDAPGCHVQMTPLLGLLRHWMHLDGSPLQLPSTCRGLLAARPRRCHLIWSARSLGVLQMLGSDLLQVGGCRGRNAAVEQPKSSTYAAAARSLPAPPPRAGGWLL